MKRHNMLMSASPNGDKVNPFENLAVGNFECGLGQLNQCSSWHDENESLDGPFFLGFPTGAVGWGEGLLVASLLKRHADDAKKRLRVFAKPEICSILLHDEAFECTPVDSYESAQAEGARSPIAILRSALIGDVLSLPFRKIETAPPRVTASHSGRRIGIAWSSVDGSGSPIPEKSVPLKHFLKVFDDVDCYAVSFQRKMSKADCELLHKRFGESFATVPIPERPVTCQAKVVEEIANLDCMVTISTTTAHMAACLGVPVLLLAADRGKRQWFWRAQKEHHKCLYPTVEVFLEKDAKKIKESGWWKECIGHARASLLNRGSRETEKQTRRLDD